MWPKCMQIASIAEYMLFHLQSWNNKFSIQLVYCTQIVYKNVQLNAPYPLNVFATS